MHSREIKSSQTTVHANLEKTLNRHIKNPWKSPIKEHTKNAFAALLDRYQDKIQAGFILDTGCGTGASSRRLSQQYPEKLVVGIDQSPERLGRGELAPLDKSALATRPVSLGNCVLLRAEAADFWRLLAQYKLIPEKIYIFYPNPWPKSAHLKRRWHGHPVFPTLLELGAPIELRSNWKIYLDEFALATQVITGKLPDVVQISAVEQENDFVSPFEKKYFLSGHKLWQLQV